MDYLEFEKPIADLAEQIAIFEKDSTETVESAEHLRKLKRDLTELTREIYSKLTPWETVQVARHKDRPAMPRRGVARPIVSSGSRNWLP